MKVLFPLSMSWEYDCGCQSACNIYCNPIPVTTVPTESAGLINTASVFVSLKTVVFVPVSFDESESATLLNVAAVVLLNTLLGTLFQNTVFCIVFVPEQYMPPLFVILMF